MPKKNSFKTIDTYNNRTLAYYQQKIKQQQYLLSTVKSCLPRSLTDHVLYCVISATNLLVYTDSAAWSSQLRFYQQSILSTMINTNTVSIQRVQIKIIIPNNSPKNTFRQNIPSKNNIKLLHYCGESIKDKRLKHALLNLSRTLTKLS
jgi:hypothetical protein